MTYAIIAEKTGWTPKQVSELNLDQVRILIKSWVEMGKDKKGRAKPATAQDVAVIQKILEGVS